VIPASLGSVLAGQRLDTDISGMGEKIHSSRRISGLSRDTLRSSLHTRVLELPEPNTRWRAAVLHVCSPHLDDMSACRYRSYSSYLLALGSQMRDVVLKLSANQPSTNYCPQTSGPPAAKTACRTGSSDAGARVDPGEPLEREVTYVRRPNA
jgi:hypothetical protein